MPLSKSNVLSYIQRLNQCLLALFKQVTYLNNLSFSLQFLVSSSKPKSINKPANVEGSNTTSYVFQKQGGRFRWFVMDVVVPELQFQGQKISVRNYPVSQNWAIQNLRFSCKEMRVNKLVSSCALGKICQTRPKCEVNREDYDEM